MAAAYNSNIKWTYTLNLLFSNIISTGPKKFSYFAAQGPRNYQTHPLPALVLPKNEPGAKNTI